MKKIIVIIIFLFGFTLVNAQEKNDTIPTKDIIIQKELSLNDFWQLYEHKKEIINPEWKQERDKEKRKLLPQKIKVDILISKGNEFLDFHSSGTYQSLIEGEYTSGLWLTNQNLIFQEQKVPFVGRRDYNIIDHDYKHLLLSKGNHYYKFINSNHPSFISNKSEKDKMIPNQGFTTNSLLRGALGMFCLILIAFLWSSNKKNINWKTVGIGLTFQLLIAIGILKVPFIKKAFEIVGKLFINILDYTRAGSEFLFGGMLDENSYGFIFVFQILPTIIFFAALTSLLFYLGIIQKLVKGMAWALTKLLGISGAESLSVAGNIFLGQTEAPLMIKAYLEKMNKSEILLVMIGGMATVAGGVLAAYIGFLGGNDEEAKLFYATHLLAASVMAAPGAIVISKILYPQTEEIDTNVKVSKEKIGSNILDAISNGTTEGLKLAANVGAMLLVFVAMIAMLNGIFGWIGDITNLNDWMAANTPYQKLSLEAILGTIFAPLMWLIGVAKEDMMLMGQLLGVKLAASEFIGYIQLAELKNVASSSHFTYDKSVIMATYMLCGFANFASIGIQIGGIGSLAPGKRKLLSEFGIKALIGGTLASLMSATIAGMILG